MELKTIKDKDYFRNLVWSLMLETGAARSKQVHDRIPDFYGNEEAAQRVFTLSAWQNAKAVKSNPDRPQRPLRQRALEEGKVL